MSVIPSLTVRETRAQSRAPSHLSAPHKFSLPRVPPVFLQLIPDSHYCPPATVYARRTILAGAYRKSQTDTRPPLAGAHAILESVGHGEGVLFLTRGGISHDSEG